MAPHYGTLCGETVELNNIDLLAGDMMSNARGQRYLNSSLYLKGKKSIMKIRLLERLMDFLLLNDFLVFHEHGSLNDLWGLI